MEKSFFFFLGALRSRFFFFRIPWKTYREACFTFCICFVCACKAFTPSIINPSIFLLCTGICFSAHNLFHSFSVISFIHIKKCSAHPWHSYNFWYLCIFFFFLILHLQLFSGSDVLVYFMLISTSFRSFWLLLFFSPFLLFQLVLGNFFLLIWSIFCLFLLWFLLLSAFFCPLAFLTFSSILLLLISVLFCTFKIF